MAVDFNPIVVDASVILKFILPDEDPTQLNRQYTNIITSGKTLIAPILLVTEVLNGICSAVLRKRMNVKQAQKVLPKFEKFSIELRQLTHRKKEILSIALQRNLSSYDAEYVALARENRCPLWTMDSNLTRKVKRHVKTIVV